MSHTYSGTFFDYIEQGARRSARVMTGQVADWLAPKSVLDLGCGRGVWLDEWRRAGVQTVCGVDGDYVDRAALAIPGDAFRPADLTQPLQFDRRYDLAQSLAVGEHLPEHAAGALVASLVAASDRIMFSAAVPGQGGEFHVNEQPLSFWQAQFAEHGYRAYDCLRPMLAGNRDIEPWYRYNTVLYINEAGAQGLPDAIASSVLPDGARVKNAGDPLWRLRRAVVSYLPQGTVTKIAQLRAARIAAKARRGALA